jgi:hypothetical protein
VDSTWSGDFVGVFDDEHAHFPHIIFRASWEFKPSLTQRQAQVYLPTEVKSFEIGGTSMLFQERIHPIGRKGEDLIGMTLKRVRVVTLARGTTHGTHKFLLFAGITSELSFDPGRWSWSDKSPLLSYTLKLGRKLLNPRVYLQRPMAQKYEPNWNEIWNLSCLLKEANFIWSMYHKAVAVNHWRAQMGPHINSRCVCCPSNEPETILDKFIYCPQTKLAWEYGLTILYNAQGIPPVNGTWPMLTWQQCLLASKLPHRLKRGKTIWSLIRGSILWIMWLDRNAKSFSDEDWPAQKIQTLIWDAIVELGCTAWLRTTTRCQHYPRLATKYIAEFDNAWFWTNFLGCRNLMVVSWSLMRPPVGSFN